MSDGTEQDRPIVVTGGSGFIGSHLVASLNRQSDRRVAIVDIEPNAASGLVAGAEVHRLDLRRDDLIPLFKSLRPSIVFHLAGQARIPESWDNPRADLESNALMTLGVLEAVRQAVPDAKVVFASSAAVYGEGTGAPFREDDPTRPIAPYGVSKLLSERYLDLYARVRGLRTASLRLFNVYGPGQRRHVVYDLMRRVSANPTELRIEGDGQQVRDFVYAGNVAEAFVLVSDRAPLHGEVYNVGDDQPVSIAALAGRICDTLKASPRISYSGTMATGVSCRWVADTTRLRELGYRARTPLSEGLAKTAVWLASAEIDCRHASEPVA